MIMMMSGVSNAGSSFEDEYRFLVLLHLNNFLMTFHAIINAIYYQRWVMIRLRVFYLKVADIVDRL